MVAVDVKNLVKHFGATEAVKGISFTVNKGEIFGLIGPNGAGKTTALRIVSTLLQITSGSVNILGFDVKKKPEATVTAISNIFILRKLVRCLVTPKK